MEYTYTKNNKIIKQNPCELWKYNPQIKGPIHSNNIDYSVFNYPLQLYLSFIEKVMEPFRSQNTVLWLETTGYSLKGTFVN